MHNPVNRLVKEVKRGLGIAASVSTLGLVKPNVFGGFTNSGAAAATLAPPPADATAGDNTAAYEADQALTARRAAAGAGDVTDVGSDADLLGSSGGIKRRAASRALLG